MSRVRDPSFPLPARTRPCSLGCMIGLLPHLATHLSYESPWLPSCGSECFERSLLGTESSASEAPPSLLQVLTPSSLATSDMLLRTCGRLRRPRHPLLASIRPLRLRIVCLPLLFSPIQPSIPPFTYYHHYYQPYIHLHHTPKVVDSPSCGCLPLP